MAADWKSVLMRRHTWAVCCPARRQARERMEACEEPVGGVEKGCRRELSIGGREVVMSAP